MELNFDMLITIGAFSALIAYWVTDLLRRV
ncbi:hypothetical protein NSPZN2_10831 [Nitrospira defluvii]|uniref:Uncharacterized protein n=1 Tax=Nitrospira defluvii TaxID=330214 RepID=A0ABN7KNL5_9BACT|nr:hypothetical protein NSPZN2_10831 [Nitrospira defluvii]